MDEELSQVVRLEQYPIDDDQFRSSCRAALDNKGLLVLPGFLTAAALDSVRAAVVVSLAIGLSRVALGVHWVSDVVAGWALGGAIALAILLARGRLRRRR